MYKSAVCLLFVRFVIAGVTIATANATTFVSNFISYANHR